MVLFQNAEFTHLYRPDTDTCIRISRASKPNPSLLAPHDVFRAYLIVILVPSTHAAAVIWELSHVDQQRRRQNDQQGRRRRCVPVYLLLELLIPLDLSFDI